ncbi:hypothetical protein [Limnohabitans sp. T6-5]|uniref:hypothetical protein n=1 Tax=Limnohabitans sp. T6-5 TaxID=1100724 RepID=UPI0018EEAACB|nr:hypothetical protein [Limnohabitans sp. T6-5]
MTFLEVLQGLGSLLVLFVGVALVYALVKGGWLVLVRAVQATGRFIASAVAEKVSALATESYLRERAERGSASKFQAALEAVPAQKPQDFDRL